MSFLGPKDKGYLSNSEGAGVLTSAKRFADLMRILLGADYSLVGEKIMKKMTPESREDRLGVLARQYAKGDPDFMQYLTGHPEKEWMLANTAGAAGVMMPLGTPMMKQIEAYHGSPHKFKKFSTAKIGTGEGAQAFGHGLYFTDKEAIANSYKDMLSKRALKIGDKIYTGEDEAVKVGADFLGKTYKTMPLATRRDAVYFAMRYPDMNAPSIVRSGIGLQQGHPSYDNAVNAVKDAQGLLTKPIGQTYKVTLHKGKTPDQYDYLRWDKPVTKQTLKRISEQYLNENKREIDFDLDMLFKGSKQLYGAAEGVGTPTTGQHLYKGIASKLGSEKEASQFLLRAGIDGIKYPAGTLSGGNKDNAFNYVVFDENAVDIDEVK